MVSAKLNQVKEPETSSLSFPTPLPLQPSERDLLKVRRMLMDVWAEENYELTKLTSSKVGPWSNDYTPFLVEPMRRLSAPGPAQVTVMACTQSGKTELGNIFFFWVLDVCPGPFMVAMPNKYTANRRVNVRYRAFFDKCPGMRAKLPGGSVNNLNIGKETILTGMVLFLAYAGSPISMADATVCFLHNDEVALFPAVSGHEGAPTELTDARTRTFRLQKKILTTSSGGVVDDALDMAFKDGNQCAWWGKCSFCRRYHPMAFDHVKFIKNADNHLLVSEAYQDPVNSWYECPVCSRRQREIDRWNMVSAGDWVPAGVRIDEHGRRVGHGKRTNHFSCRVQAWMVHPRFMTIAEVAEKWAKAIKAKKGGNIIPLRDFVTKQKGESWEERGREIDEDKLTKKINPKLHKRCVPNECRCVVAGCDYHEDETGQVRIDYTVKAFQPGMISYTVDAGSVENFESLERVLFTTPLVWAEDSEAPEPVIVTVFIDSGYKPDAVYSWCRKHKGRCWPTKGQDSQRIPLDMKKLDKVMEDAQRRVRRGRARRYTGMHLINMDTSYFKDQASSWAEAPIGGEGSTEFFAELPEWYLAEFCAEHKVPERRGAGLRFVWKLKGGTPSHALDTEVLAAAAGHFNKVWAMGAGAPAPRPKRRIGRVQRFRK